MCDTMVHVTADGVLFAKNSDRDPNEAQLLEWHDTAEHPGGSEVSCTYLRVPQPGRTNATLISRPFWMWGAEMGVNEHGVAIGNEAVFTTEPYADEGLLGMDLLRLALERASTADEAVEQIVSLIETYGQGGGCGHENRSFTYHNSFIVADPVGAIVLETAGRHHATEVVRSGARSISNGLTISGFADRFADRVRGRVAACDIRQQHTQRRTAAARGPRDLMQVLRSHGAGRATPRWHRVNGAMDAPAMHAGGLVANSQTTASWVSSLRSEHCGHWATATAAPDTSIFKPVAVSESVDLGPAPTDEFDARSLWWRHELLHRVATRDAARLYPIFRDERDEVETSWAADPPPSAQAFAEADEMLRRWTKAVLSAAGPDTRPWYTRRYWRERDRRAGVPTPKTWPISPVRRRPAGASPELRA